MITLAPDQQREKSHLQLFIELAQVEHPGLQFVGSLEELLGEIASIVDAIRTVHDVHDAESNADHI